MSSAPGGGTQARLIFAGVPGITYHVQSTGSLTSPINWNTLPDTVTANAQGQFQITIPAPSATTLLPRDLSVNLLLLYSGS